MPDPAAFLDELLPLRDALYGFARKASFRPDLAADLVQQASLIAWREFPRFRPGTNFRAWMFRILVNTVHTSNKHAGRERRRADPVADPERLCGADLGAAFEQEEAWASVRSDPSRLADLLGDHLAAALGAVPEEPRTALLLRLIGDLTYREISGVLQLPVGTVMSHVHRARQELRRRLASREVARRAASGEPSSPSERTEEEPE